MAASDRNDAPRRPLLSHPLLCPPEKRVEAAAQILARMAEIDALQEGVASFRRDDLTCMGWFRTEAEAPPETKYFTANVPVWSLDTVDLEASFARLDAWCELEIRQGIERWELDRELTRRALERAEA